MKKSPINLSTGIAGMDIRILAVRSADRIPTFMKAKMIGCLATTDSSPNSFGLSFIFLGSPDSFAQVKSLIWNLFSLFKGTQAEGLAWRRTGNRGLALSPIRLEFPSG